MYIDMNDNSMKNFDRVMNELKRLLDIFIGKFSGLRLEKLESDEDLQMKLDNINNLMGDIADKLESLKNFENEFYNFLSIQNMIGYITCSIEKYAAYSDFVNELTSSFCDLINTKIRMIEYNEYENYEKIYKAFDDYLYGHEEFFYLNIYEPTHQYDELIREVNNLLW